jgi:hypothetical protein
MRLTFFTLNREYHFRFRLFTIHAFRPDALRSPLRGEVSFATATKSSRRVVKPGAPPAGPNPLKTQPK